MKSLSYDTIIQELDRIFPEFTKVSDLADLSEGLPGVHLGFFINYAADRWSNETFHLVLSMFRINFKILSQFYNKNDQPISGHLGSNKKIVETKKHYNESERITYHFDS